MFQAERHVPIFGTKMMTGAAAVEAAKERNAEVGMKLAAELDEHKFAELDEHYQNQRKELAMKIRKDKICLEKQIQENREWATHREKFEKRMVEVSE